MNDWYYAKGGQQQGPVTLPELQQLLCNGGLDPNKDLVWAAHLNDWKPANQVEELKGSKPPHPPSGVAQASAFGTNMPVAADVSQTRDEIQPGSDPIDIGACITRGFELTKANFGNLVLVLLLLIGFQIALSLILQFGFGFVLLLIGSFAHAAGIGEADQKTLGIVAASLMILVGLVFWLLALAATTFINLGMKRFMLNLVSGYPAEVSHVFGEGAKLLRALGASILFFLMVLIGSLLFIAPGIYLSLRYGMFFTAIVDRNLGVFEAFEYSSRITQNNKWRLLGLAIVAGLIAMSGVLLCLVGVIFTGPVAMLAWVAGYRWMQYGRSAIERPV